VTNIYADNFETSDYYGGAVIYLFYFFLTSHGTLTLCNSRFFRLKRS